MEKWCERAKKAMKEQGITQKNIADMIGRSRVTVSKVLNGEISDVVINEISDYLNISNTHGDQP